MVEIRRIRSQFSVAPIHRSAAILGRRTPGEEDRRESAPASEIQEAHVHVVGPFAMTSGRRTDLQATECSGSRVPA